jgi:hypothetical protein
MDLEDKIRSRGSLEFLSFKEPRVPGIFKLQGGEGPWNF